MITKLRRLLFDYGMVLVLLLLCVFFSIKTMSEQEPTGDTAARNLARDVVAAFGKQARVLVVVRDQPEEVAFLHSLQGQLASSGVYFGEPVKGEPKDARAALERLVKAGDNLDAIGS